MEKGNYKDIELRSEEVQEVMNRTPPAVLRYGIGILAGIMLVLLVGSALFSYPETVQVEVTLTTLNPPAYIKNMNSGRIEKLYAVNGQQVKKGDVLAVMENVANTENVLWIRECLANWQANGSKPEKLDIVFMQRLPKLGNVQGAYASCMLAWNNYLRHIGESRIHGTELENAVAQLTIAIDEWEKVYLPTAPIDGQVAFMQPWKDKQYVGTEETMFVIVPNNDAVPVGKALLPIQKMGKIRIGQRALIRLSGFSEQEYGFWEGRIQSISPVPDENGNYVAEISFPKNFRTNNGKEFPTIKVIHGTAEIIIREQSLLERLL